MWYASENLRALLQRKRVQCQEQSPTIDVDGLDAPQNAQPSATQPVQYENYAREYMQITQQDNFDGFRLEAGSTLSPVLQLSHSLILGTSLAECGYIYNFGPIFQSKDQKSVVVGKVGLDRSVNGRIIHKCLNDFAELKLNGNYSFRDPNRAMYEAALDFTGNSWCSSAKVCWQMAWIFNGALSKMITPNLHLGGECIKIGVQNGGFITTAGFRWAEGQDFFTGQYNRSPDFKNPLRRGMAHSAKFQYVRKVTDRLQIGTELEVQMPYEESSLKVGYEYTFRQARVQGLIDTSGKVSTVVSDMQGFGVSGMIDYVRGDYKFGFMMHMYPPPDDPLLDG